jgi:two-component system sensor histidine kinase TctE
MSTRALSSGLRRRLLVMLMVPLGLLAMASAWVDYLAAGDVARQQDHHLQSLAPLLADSVVRKGSQPDGAPVVLLAPAVAEFLKDRSGSTAYAIANLQGHVLAGDTQLNTDVPATHEPEFHSEIRGGVMYRIVAQRFSTPAGELVVQLADGSDARQRWLESILFKVLAPNLLMVLVAAFTVNLAVRRALKPLTDLKDTLEHRSSRDLRPIDAQASPEEVKPLVDSLNRLFALANAQAESQRRFVADAAHQLRTPLAGLQAQVEAWALLANARMDRHPRSGGNPSEPTRHSRERGNDGLVGEDSVGTSAPCATTIAIPIEQINKLRNATRRTSQLANQLLALSRADAQALTAQPVQRVDLQELCETVLHTQLDAATAHGLDLGLDAQPAHVSGHDWLLRELLANLVDNAVKYAGPGASVTIRSGLCDGRPFIEVTDDGPGIAAGERGRVLERFYRVPGTAGDGNGLGLAIVQEIARLHQASVQLLDGPGGRGLRARLAFPVHP